MKTASTKADFDQRYQTHLKHLKLKGLQPKTIDAYSRAIRHMGDYFDYSIDNLSSAQLTDYFSDLVDSHSWSAVKHDLYGFKFYTQHLLGKPWVMPNFIKPPKTQRLPDIVTVEQAQALFLATRTLSYKVFYFTLYSMGLRLSEGLAAPSQRLQPYLYHVITKCCNCTEVRRYRMVRIEPAHNRFKPRPLFRNRVVHSFSHLTSDLHQLSSHSVCTRLAPEHKFAPPGLCADECESQKRECFRFALSTPLPVCRRIASKLDQACLFPMQFESELLKPLSHRVQEASGI
jgi:hypothetical protein